MKLKSQVLLLAGYATIFMIFTALAALFAHGQSFNTTSTTSCVGCALRVANGVVPLPVSAIPGNACVLANPAPAQGALPSDTVIASFNADPTLVNGFQPGSMLTLIPWVSPNQVNIKICNQLTTPVTPGVVSLAWRVIR